MTTTATTLEQDGTNLVRGISVAELVAAGVKFDAATDSDVGPDACRLVASLDRDTDGRYWYGVEFLQLDLRGALVGREPRWEADRRTTGYQRQLRSLFTEAEQDEIDAQRREYEAAE